MNEYMNAMRKREMSKLVTYVIAETELSQHQAGSSRRPQQSQLYVVEKWVHKLEADYTKVHTLVLKK
jgi:hypothetical protein